MILDTFKAYLAEIYYLANTPSYIYRNIVNMFSNVDFQTISEDELEIFENSINENELYLFYLVIFIKIKNDFKFDLNKYNHVKWYNEYITYCKMKQTNTSIYSFSIGDEIVNLNSTYEVNVNV
jgi:hypothetical protein